MHLRSLAAIAAIALGLAACGSDTDTASSASTVPTTVADVEDVTTTTTAEPTDTTPEAPVVDLSDLAGDPAAMSSAVVCGDEGDAGTVLLVHGTGTTPGEAFGPSLAATLPPLGYEVCTVELPGRSTVDIQESTEYVVAAVRSIAARKGEPVAIVAHSQGVLQARAAVAYWPDVAAASSMIVAIGGPNGGSPAVTALCAEGCVPALWQMDPDSAFLAALDTAWSAIDLPVTAIRTMTDEFIPPESAAGIDDAVVVTVQDWCPDREVSHAGQLVDPIAHAGIVSALSNGGLAQTTDLEQVGCTESVVAGGDLAGVDAAGAAAFGFVLSAEPTDAEPPVTLGR